MSDQVDKYQSRREQMVDDQIIARGITDERVLVAMLKVPRHIFAEPRLREQAYEDKPLFIAEGQTISQPYVVALMLSNLGLKPKQRVLEVGTGSGYQTALLCELGVEVYTIELDGKLLEKSVTRLQSLGYTAIKSKCGDGHNGWKERAPFDAIIVSAAAESIPRELVKQLAVGGRLIIPIGVEEQELALITKTEAGLESKEFGSVKFVELKQAP